MLGEMKGFDLFMQSYELGRKLAQESYKGGRMKIKVDYIDNKQVLEFTTRNGKVMNYGLSMPF